MEPENDQKSDKIIRYYNKADESEKSGRAGKYG